MSDWLLIGHRSDLSQPNDFIRIPMGARGIVAFNDGGTVIVTDGICPHRGTNMVDKPFGNAPLTCPYHGWAYHGGKMHIPQCSKYNSVEVGKARLRQYFTQWVGDWLFASETPGEIVMPAKLRELLESIVITSRRHFDSMTIACDWRVAVENALEDLHVPMIHRDSIGKIGIERQAMERFGASSIALYKVTDKRTQMSLTKLAEHFDNVNPEEYFHLFLYPHTCLSSVGGVTYSLQHYMPSAGWTNFSTRLYVGAVRPEAPNYNWFYDEARKFNDLVFRQDADICAKVQDWGHALSEDEQRVRWFREAQA